jgi:uncharacterized membrane protein
LRPIGDALELVTKPIWHEVDEDQRLEFLHRIAMAVTTKRGARCESNGTTRKTLMETIEKTIEVDAPVTRVYNQWTQFEEFPRFMEGIKEVRQIDDTHLHWKAEIAGKEEEWDAEIVRQVPDQVVAWRSTSGAENTGAVEFGSTASGKTQVTLTLRFEPEDAIEKVGDAIGVVSARVQGDLNRFKEFLEKRGCETGGWRGEVSRH